MLSLPLFLLIFTKTADIFTSWRGLRGHGLSCKQKPVVHWTILRFGPPAGITGLVLAACYAASSSLPLPCRWTAPIGGWGVSWTQLTVARFNGMPQHILGLLGGRSRPSQPLSAPRDGAPIGLKRGEGWSLSFRDWPATATQSDFAT